LKQLITIILSISLYAPQVAKILAYTDCSIQVLANGDPFFCDCNRIIDIDAIPIAPDRQDKQKEISLKADWKYIGETNFKFFNASWVIAKTTLFYQSGFVPQPYLQSIFHPPQA
jgi:hypothetical protein